MQDTFFTLKIPKEFKVQRTYFFRLPNGELFACNEKEASSMLRQQKIKFIGSSSGEVFSKMLQKAVEAQRLDLQELGEFPDGEKLSVRKTWVKKRQAIEQVAKEAVGKAQEAECLVAKKGKKVPPPDRTVEIFGDPNGVINMTAVRRLS